MIKAANRRTSCPTGKNNLDEILLMFRMSDAETKRDGPGTYLDSRPFTMQPLIVPDS